MRGIEKEVTVTIEKLDLVAIGSVNSLGSSLNRLKRTSNELIDDYVDPDSVLNFLENPSFFAISDTTVKSTTFICNDSNGIEEGIIFNQEVILVQKADTIQVKSKKRHKLVGTVLLDLKLNEESDLELVSQDIKILRSSKIRSSQLVKYDLLPTLTITHIKDSRLLKLSLRYKYSLVESLMLDFPSELFSSLQVIMKNLLRVPQSIYSNVVDNKLFYNTVTDNALNCEASGKPPIVSELGTDLLDFQGQTVNWMLSKENMKYHPEDISVRPKNGPVDNSSTENKIKNRLNQFCFGFELLEFQSSAKDRIWFNKYTGNLCTSPKAIEYINSLQIPGGVGLLCEEMGLGKTVEVVSLSLLNPRSHSDLSETLQDQFGRDIKKVKASLIICPDSILQQWVDEITLHAPSLNVMVYRGIYGHQVITESSTGKKRNREMTSSELTHLISTHDIVVTSYATVSKEIHNASYNPERFKRLRTNRANSMNFSYLESFQDESEQKKLHLDDKNFKIEQDLENFHNRIDHTSPLIKLEFWRLILDEAQMVGTGLSNRCRIATLIPRFHSWAVSGTPIKNDVVDLNALLVFLKYTPFNNTSKWNMLLKHPDDFIKLIQFLGFRHTKELVKNEIQLPVQRRVLMNIPFGPIEQDHYQELYKKFLRDVGLDENGDPIVENWEPSSSYYETMRYWLRSLRTTCCHANFDLDFSKNFGTSGSSKFNTMEDVLQMIIKNEKEAIDQIERKKTLETIELGQIFEFLKDPEGALATWEIETRQVEQKINFLRNELKSTTDEFWSSSVRISLRSSLELLHRLYFFVGSAHFQLYDNLTTQYLVKEELQRLKDESLDGIIKFDRVLNEQESIHQQLESDYYGKAQNTRKILLSESIKNVENAIEKLDTKIIITVITPKDKFKFTNVEGQVIFSRINTLLNNLNEQSLVLNKYFEKLEIMLKTQLFDTVTDPTGDEYLQSLDDQSNSSVYLEVLQNALKNRSSLLFGNINGEYYEPISHIVQNGKGTDNQDDDLKAILEKGLPLPKLPYSLKTLLIDLKPLIGKQPDGSMELKYLVLLETWLKNELEEQKSKSAETSKIFRSFNDIYNLKITYFRQLQELSDNVVAFDEVRHSRQNVLMKQIELKSSIPKFDALIEQIKLRVRYLSTLSINDRTPESEKLCAICQSSITIGSLLKCGHRYCKDCLAAWLKRKSSCPICKEKVNKNDIYDFTFNREDIDVSLNVEHHGDRDKEISEVYEKSEKDSLQSLKEIPLNESYSTKIDTIVRQVLWLKRKDTSVQIIIYSQWGRLLNTISKALRQNGIYFTGTDRSLENSLRVKDQVSRKTLSEIESFKKNPRITCFLLNAKADASGLNLINATHVFLCEPLVQTALESQAISRIHRIGQKKPTTIWMFSIADTIEENIVLLSSRKRIKEKEKLETEEMSKSTKTLVSKTGEVIETDDLWNSFFCSKMDYTG